MGRRAHAWSSVSVRQVHRALWQRFASLKTTPNPSIKRTHIGARRCGPVEKHLKRCLSRGHDLRPRPQASSSRHQGFDRRVIDAPPSQPRSTARPPYLGDRARQRRPLVRQLTHYHSNVSGQGGDRGLIPEKSRYAHAIPQLYRDGHPTTAFEPISDCGDIDLPALMLGRPNGKSALSTLLPAKFRIERL